MLQSSTTVHDNILISSRRGGWGGPDQGYSPQATYELATQYDQRLFEPGEYTPETAFRGCFLRTRPLFFYELTQHSPAFFTRASITSRLYGWLRASCGQDMRALRLCGTVPHHLTVAWHSRRAAWMLRQGVDCTDARLSTYRTRGPGQQRRHRELFECALHGPAHRVGARLEMRTGLEDQLQLGGEAYTEIAHEGTLGVQLRSPPYFRRRFASFQRQRGPADPPISVVFLCANAPVHACHIEFERLVRTYFVVVCKRRCGGVGGGGR